MWMRLSLSLLVALLVVGSPVPADAKQRQQAIVHTVYSGQTLGMIAKRYNVSIEAICRANGIARRDPIKPKQKLVIPASDDTSGKRAARSRARRSVERKDRPRRESKAKEADPEPPEDDLHKRYMRPARRKGHVILQGTSGSWQGYAIVKGNKVSGPARAAFRRVLRSWRTGDSMEISNSLIRLVTRISDAFGGRPVRIVSGFRQQSFSRESKHKLGRAVDLSVIGVPNEALRDFARTLPGVGVGYYPNSSFVHVDVRPKKTYWVDLSGPGEPPRYAGRGR